MRTGNNKVNRQQYRVKLREWYQEYKSKQECRDCHTKENLTFHHIEPHKKEDSVYNVMHKSRSFNRMKGELKKCIALCRSCHDKVHGIQRKVSK